MTPRRCRIHPSMTMPKRAMGCALCGTGAVVESDRNKFEREVLANHIEPGQGHKYRSHGAYQRLLKKHRLTDDIPTREIVRLVNDPSKREAAQEAAIQRQVNALTPSIERKLAQQRSEGYVRALDGTFQQRVAQERARSHRRG